MKQLQNNYTTPEQSKRLLELGLPVDSADCYYDTYDIEHSNCLRPYFLDERTYTDYFKHLSCIGTNVHTPCWSVGRLIEIMLNSQIDTGTYALGIMLDKDMFSIESLIDIIDEDIKEFDFSKLED